MAMKNSTKKTSTRSTPKKAPREPKKPAAATTAKSRGTQKAGPAAVAEAPAPKAAPQKGRTKKANTAATAKAPGGKRKGKCGTGEGKCKAPCSKGTCTKPQLDGRSLLDRARNCESVEECRKFIGEFDVAVTQANQWLDDMHAQALSAEETRDIYSEQISDLLEAIDIDRARIVALEADLKKERAKAPDSAATNAVLDKLVELGKEVKSLRSELERLLEGRGLSTARRQQARKATGQGRRARGVADDERAVRGRGRPRTSQEGGPRERSAGESADVGGGLARETAVMEGRPTQRLAQKPPGAFAKYSVLRGAACSLGVGKYGYPPEVCAPASFSRSEAAEILGTYAQNKYAGLAKWAIITGLPIDDIAVPLVPMKPRGVGADKVTATVPPRQRAAKAARAAAPRSGSRKAAADERSNKQVLDQVLLTVARI